MTYHDVRAALLRFYDTHAHRWDSAYLKEKQDMVKTFAAIATKDFRTFKIAMVAIESLRHFQKEFAFLVKMHKNITEIPMIYSAPRYNEFFDKSDKMNLLLMKSRVARGIEDVIVKED
jgi:hypothetical protein